MATRHSRREAFYFHNSLTGLAKSIENKYTTVDLRNEASVTGKIVLVDGFMNVSLEDAVYYDALGREFPFESFFIRARNIRYIHLPININILEAIKGFGHKKAPVKTTKKSFKKKRVQVEQEKTIAEAFSDKP